jgi:hypothetical protein
MTDQKSEKSSEIWLKYCEDCIKSKLESNGDSVTTPAPQGAKKNPSSF